MRFVFIGIIKLYKKLIAPLIGFNCRFYPSCSDYAVEAIKSEGAIKGLAKAILRILRCNPFSSGGYDPVRKEKFNG